MAKLALVGQEQALEAWCRLHLESEGHEVTCLRDYAHASEVIRHRHLDLALIDIDGNETDALALALQSNSRTAKLPLIFICSADRPDRIAQAAAMRPNDLVTKPLARDVLVQSVARRLEAGGRRSGPRDAERRDPPSAPPIANLSAAGLSAGPRISIRQSAALVVTIRNFVQLARTLTADALQKLLNRSMSTVAPPVLGRGGWIARMDGTGITAIFESQSRGDSDHGRAAIEAALEIVLASRQMKRWSAQLCPGAAMPDISIGCGVHAGEVVTAQFSIHGTLTSTIDGETIQIAHRLDGRSKGLGWSVGVTELVLREGNSRFLIGRQASLTDTDRRAVIPIFEVLGISPTATQAQDLPHLAKIREAVNANSMSIAPRGDVDFEAMDQTMTLQDARRNLPSRFPDLPGRRLEHWLDRSGLARVAVAHNLTSRVQEVIKFVASADCPTNCLESFLEEFEAASTIAERNCAAVLDLGRTSEIAFAALEWIPGPTLIQAIRKKLTVSGAMNYLAQMCMSLDALHAVGLIHGGLLPPHFSCRTDGAIVLTNFGIVRRIARQLGIAHSDAKPGSAKYLAPELLRGTKPGPTADFFSVGVMFGEMLLGEQPPVLPTERTDFSTQPIRPLPVTLAPLQSCLDKLLAVDPGARFSCGEDVIAELIALRHHLLV